MTFKNTKAEFDDYFNYENITIRTRNQKFRHPLFLYGTIIAGIIVFYNIYNYFLREGVLSAVTIWTVIAIVLVVLYWLTIRNYLIIDLDDGKFINFLKDNPNKIEFDEFIEVLYNTRNKMLYDRYCHIDMNNDKQMEITKFSWLLREKVITKETYDLILEELEEGYS